MERFKTIARFLKDRGIEAYFVGGCVRDEILGIEPDDIDVVVTGATTKTMDDALWQLATDEVISCYTTVHGSFPIWIVEFDGERYEFALARTERSTGEEHQAFECETENVSIEMDLLRRDLTINAMAKNILTGDIIDPYNGRLHLQKRIAYPVSAAFNEDPLRVIRAARFIARFNLSPVSTLVGYCVKLKPDSISRERIGMELKKLFEKPSDAKMFFDFLELVDWLKPVFPEVYAMRGVPQSPNHHPEGDVYIHTMHCIAACKPTDWFTKAVMLGHDMGKVTKTTVNGFPWPGQDWEHEKIQSIGHEEESAVVVKDFLKRIKFSSHKIISQISVLVQQHMIRTMVKDDTREKIVRRTLRLLMANGLKYSQLVEVVRCDLSGRPPRPVVDNPDIGQEHATKLIERGEMTPIVTGELLIKCGMKSSPDMGKVVERALDLQDRGVLKKDNWLTLLRGAGMKEELKDVKHLAPWSETLVRKLNYQQQQGTGHPYTCCSFNVPECERSAGLTEGILIATVDGWVCPCGRYKQNWCH